MSKWIYFLVLVLVSGLSASDHKPIRVYADISGDMLHAGHMEFFKQARALGDELVIGVLSDEDIASYKRLPILTLQERATMVRACRYVDEVIEGPPLCASREFLIKHRIDFVVHGDDFDPKSPLAKSQYGPAMEMGIFVQVPYTAGISTTDIIHRILARADELK